MKRRDFIRHSAVVGASFSLATFTAAADAKPADKQPASERLRYGLIGAGNMGRGDANKARHFGELVAIADVDLAQAEKAKTQFGGKATIYQDYRKLLDRKDIDVVIQATPDHWHTKINIDACRAGKDIYAEKPLTLTIAEGQILCKVVKETGRVFQTGTQQRSEPPFFQTAVELVRNGHIGKLSQVLVALPYYSTKGGPFPEEPIPPTLDWPTYLGQAPLHYYNAKRCHRSFRSWYEYAGGVITDWGSHHMDIAHWGMDTERTGPLTIEARGNFPNEGRSECFNTPDRFFSRMVYPNGVELLFFAANSEKAENQAKPEAAKEQYDRLYGKDTPKEVRESNRNGVTFIGDQGRIFVNRGGVYGKAVDELKENPLPANAWKVRPSINHMKNFFDCVRSREIPVADVETAHRSVSACHLTNISIRLGGRKLTWDPTTECFPNDREADGFLRREQRAPFQT